MASSQSDRSSVRRTEESEGRSQRKSNFHFGLSIFAMAGAMAGIIYLFGILTEPVPRLVTKVAQQSKPPARNTLAERVITEILKARQLDENERLGRPRDDLKSIDINKDSLWWNSLGDDCLLKGEFDNAAEHYRNAILLQPKNSLFHFNRGLAYKAKKDYSKALENFDKAIRLKPDSPVYHHNRKFVVSKLSPTKVSGGTHRRWRARESAEKPPVRSTTSSVHDIPTFAFYSTSGTFKVYKLGEVIEQKRVNDHRDGSLRFMNLGNGRGKILGNAGTGAVQVRQTKNSISFTEVPPLGEAEHIFTVYDEWDSSVNGYRAVYHRTVNSTLLGETMKTNYSGYAKRAE